MKQDIPLAISPNGTLGSRHSENDKISYSLTEQAFAKSSIPLIDKLEAFPRFVPKRSIARFLAKHELFKKILGVTGIIVECGVFNGAGLFSWAQLSNIYEPANHTRKIVGFDTFNGFPGINKDMDNTAEFQNKVGDLRGSSLEELLASAKKHNKERHLSHINNIDFVSGDFFETSEKYLQDNPHTIISLLYLDFDLYEPTKRALELFLPKMPKGAIVAFDEINCNSFPGETRALEEVMGINSHRINRFTIDPWISYIEL
ncbi:class I SAM-dependent methyltransferase [Comamonas sp. NLF-1-9]|uniref:class I SAM-dependent methyltransferase n=1 Tax=Comamonas sp. NLF-1-9 TaxID=2853163 RepID=UPI001C496B08|nr:class I SAM-dependent methyltransferase [Comamonas sp. NLF-1-9]QXL84223.1 class I SAM-dependent methyltransferase [Comamonas sp. NLF-1-9]